jgi:hypothetical protein
MRSALICTILTIGMACNETMSGGLQSKTERERTRAIDVTVMSLVALVFDVSRVDGNASVLLFGSLVDRCKVDKFVPVVTV